MQAFTRFLLDAELPLGLSELGLTQQGGILLSQEVHRRQVILVGEVHGTVEIPLFVEALVRSLPFPGPSPILAIETGAMTAEYLQKIAVTDNPTCALRVQYDLFGKFVPFYDAAEELELLRNLSTRRWKIVGVDHEFITSLTMLLDGIEDELQVAARANRTAALHGLVLLNRLRREIADNNVKPDVSSLLRVSPSWIAELEKLAKRVSGAAVTWVSELATAYEVYAYHHRGELTQSAAKRTMGMCSRAHVAIKEAESSGSQILFKVGYNHACRGLNHLAKPDLGSCVKESHPDALHILIVGQQGTQLVLQEVCQDLYSREDRIESDLNDHFSELSPIFSYLPRKQCVLLDLKSLRKSLPVSTCLTQRQEKLLSGSDYIVIFPELHAAQRSW